MRVPSSIEFLDVMKRKGFKVFTEIGNINILGFRAKYGAADSFDDTIAVYIAKSGGVFDFDYFPATTLPGISWLKNPMNKNGTAILVPGQYLESYQIGIYRGYDALRQVGPVKVYRDDNRDGKVDTSHVKIETGLFGIHIHRAGILSKVVGVSSAGCQVFQARKDFDVFMGYCKEAAKLHGNSFSYTLLDEV